MSEPNKPSAIYGNAIFVREKKDVPQQEHWAILKFKQMSQPGYDKGDPPYLVTVVEWDAYLNKADAEKAVLKLESEKYCPHEYVVVKIGKPATINTTVQLS